MAKASKIKLDKDEVGYFDKQFKKTLEIVDELNQINTSNAAPTYQVTGKKNALREDKIDVTRVLTQEEALSNAKNTHNGYFVVEAILDEH